MTTARKYKDISYSCLISCRIVCLVTAMLLLAGGCRSDMPDIGHDPDGVEEMTVSFSLSTLTPVATTRANGYLGDGYDTGEGYENYIDIPNKDFRFYFFDSDNKYLSTFEVSEILPVEVSPGAKHYEVLGVVPKEIADNELKIVCLANWKNYPDDSAFEAGVTDISEIWNMTFEYDPDMMMPSARNTIPLYGVTNELKLEFNNAGFAAAGVIHLLRAWAKIEVAQDKEKDGQTLTEVEIVRYNTEGYCAPSGVRRQDDYVKGSYDKDYVLTPHIVAEKVSENVITLKKDADGRFVGYVPEYVNTKNSTPISFMRVKFKESADADFVYFREYENGVMTSKDFDLLRNNWYKYTVWKKLELFVDVQVVPYREVSLDPDYGLKGDYPLSPIYDANEMLVAWLDPIKGTLYLDMQRTTKIHPAQMANMSVDPLTGRHIVRDNINTFIGFTEVTGVNDGASSAEDVEHADYAFDTATKLECPLRNRHNISNADGSGRYVMLPIMTLGDKTMLYWQDENNGNFYAPDGKTLLAGNPYEMALNDENAVKGGIVSDNWREISMMKYVRADGSVIGWRSVGDWQWYAADGTTPMADPFPNTQI